MKQVTFSQFGPPQVMGVTQAPLPQPRAGEVRIRVAAAGINRADVAQRQGTYAAPPGASPILGLEVSGHIDALGAGPHTLAEGDAVCALTAGGGYAEYVCVPAAHCLPIPRGLSVIEAAALPEAAMTVWSNLFGPRHLREGETLLVHGGTSGIGSFAILLARALGHPTIATVGNAEKLRCVHGWGAQGINYREVDFVDEVQRLTQGRGVDVVLDMVGHDYVNRNLRCLAMDGRIVQIAFQKGARANVDLMELLRRRAVLTGSLLRPRSDHDKASIVAELKTRVWPLFASGCLPAPPIDTVFPMAHVGEAHERMEASLHIGKMLLVWSS